MDFFQEELAAKVAEQQAAVMAAGLLDKKESEDSSAVIGPSMLEPEPFHAEVKAAVLFFFGTLRFIHALDMFAEAITFEYTYYVCQFCSAFVREQVKILQTLWPDVICSSYVW